MSTRQIADIARLPTQFGGMAVRPDEIIHFDQGIMPFTEAKRFVLVRHEDIAPFAWLVAVDESELAFVVGRPEDLLGSGVMELTPEEVAQVHLVNPEDCLTLLIVVVGQYPTESTVNLLAPLLINPLLGLGKQIVCAGDIEMCCCPLGIGAIAAQLSPEVGRAKVPA